MRERKVTVERNREATEKRLLDAVGGIIAEEGFEKIGINAVAARSGVSKVLIYRYFGSVEGLMAAYIRRHDFWINFPLEIPEKENIISFIKEMFYTHIEKLRSDPTLKRLYRWELSGNNEMIDKLREQREKLGLDRIEKISGLTGYPPEEMAVMATFLTASITYLVMLEDFCPVYNGILINTDAGWNKIKEGIGTFLDKYFQNG